MELSFQINSNSNGLKSIARIWVDPMDLGNDVTSEKTVEMLKYSNNKKIPYLGIFYFQELITPGMKIKKI